MALKSAFPPSVDADTRLLILGSLPGDASIRQGEYYAHRGNAFWHLIGDVLEEDLRGQPYALRLKRLRARGVSPTKRWAWIFAAHGKATAAAAST